ncbi:MAG: hypothetical protein OK456_09730 [Thaumarchaeota archaeon]|nr:hypothetical protein [Nitrososphaerota archaeon]
MSSRNPIGLHNGLSRFSVFALIGLMAFAAIVLVANPFAAHPAGASIPTANAPQPPTSGQGSLLTGAPSPTQTGGVTGSGGHHHHQTTSTSGSTSASSQ